MAMRVGGQALPDGVFLRAGTRWAVARADGSVETGVFRPARLGRVPVVRVLAGLGPALAVGLRAMAGRPQGRRRTRGALVAAGLVAASILGERLPGSTGVLPQLAGALAALGALRLVTPPALWRYHGAEHKVVAAHEAGADPTDLAAALAASRIHDRCGTNLVALVLPLAATLASLPLLAQLAALALATGVAAEVLTVAASHPRALPSRLVLAPGRALQRLTTAEPAPAEQAVACRALAAALGEPVPAAG